MDDDTSQSVSLLPESPSILTLDTQASTLSVTSSSSNKGELDHVQGEQQPHESLAHEPEQEKKEDQGHVTTPLRRDTTATRLNSRVFNNGVQNLSHEGMPMRSSSACVRSEIIPESRHHWGLEY